ncbi:hypothetical protein ACKC9G_12480 [Pokkaliibacter sp. CJK22405]|uniref:hypothetical protein n=1 Tax=Pokkaliibacter sp. CJK22405 TaxID=3384615 RepID=UPI0039849210
MVRGVGATTIRQHMQHYSRVGNSDGQSLEVISSKPEAARLLYHVSDQTMGKLMLSSAVAKTLDKLCMKGNQLDDVHCSSSESSFREQQALRAGLSGNQIETGVFAGNCGPISTFGEHILGAMNSRVVVPGTGIGKPGPITVCVWDGDHEFPLIGDPREKPMDQVVPVDGWVMRPSAHTFANSGFNRGYRIYSSTVQEPVDYLDKPIVKHSLGQLQQRYGSGPAVDLNTWYNQVMDNVRDGSFRIWDQQYGEFTTRAGLDYFSPSKGLMNFDYLPREEVLEKGMKHHAASSTPLAELIRIHDPYRHLRGD